MVYTFFTFILLQNKDSMIILKLTNGRYATYYGMETSHFNLLEM
jgi:hypothetical protein